MPIDRIAVIGGGVGGWLAASLIARALPDVRVSVTESKGPDRSLGITNAAETLFPADLETLAAAGIDEDALIRGARGSFALGRALSGWHGESAPGFVPFGDIGAPLGPTAFHQLVARQRDAGAQVNLANYSLGALCAQSGRFARARPGDRSVHATLAYGLHVETSALAKWLRADAIARGAQLCDAPGGSADLVIDASGPDSAHGGPFESWAHHFPCDRAAAALRPSGEAPQPYAHIEAHAAGWQAFVPVHGAIGDTFVYAHEALPDGPPGETFEAGRQEAAWRGNVLSIGGAAALVDPVAGTQLHLALADVSRLIALFPNDRACAAEASEYNRRWREETDCAFDFALLHTARNGVTAAPFWAEARSRPLPDRLAHRIALFESCGRVVLHDGELFEEPQWVATLDALNIHARRHDALAHGITLDQIETHFARIRAAMLEAVGAMPPHAAYLDAIAR
jgi:tryptophan 7-halogenase